jgi:hypothetical protein
MGISKNKTMSMAVSKESYEKLEEIRELFYLKYKIYVKKASIIQTALEEYLKNIKNQLKEVEK